MKAKQKFKLKREWELERKREQPPQQPPTIPKLTARRSPFKAHFRVSSKQVSEQQQQQNQPLLASARPLFCGQREHHQSHRQQAESFSLFQTCRCTFSSCSLIVGPTSGCVLALRWQMAAFCHQWKLLDYFLVSSFSRFLVASILKLACSLAACSAHPPNQIAYLGVIFGGRKFGWK